MFSAGLDIMEMYGQSPERCAEFWRAVQEMWLKLYSSNMAVIAAINVIQFIHVIHSVEILILFLVWFK